MKLTLENCSSIHVSALQSTIRKLINRDYPDANTEEVYNHTLDELNKFSVNGQKFEYQAIPNRLGGYRFFFLCPKCMQKASKLFLPPKDCNLEYRYLCKRCHNLKNQSVVMGQSKLYKQVFKPMKRMKEIEKKLEGGYLNVAKAEELLNEYDDLEKVMKSSPEYRVYLFKKKRGKI